MRPALLIPVLVGLAAANDAEDGVPKCARPCVQKFTSGDEIAGCKQLEIGCVCKNNDFLDGVACCLEDACDQAGKDAAVKYAQQICSTAGVKVPNEVVCKNSTSTTETPGTATDTAASETSSPAAAPGLSAAAGAVGALFAALVAL